MKELNINSLNQDYSYLLDPFQSINLPHPYSDTQPMQARDFNFNVKRPEEQDLGNFRGVNRDVDNKYTKISGEPSGEFPITYRTIENWWEFEKFNKLMDYSNLYIQSVKEWHKYTVKARIRHETYRPYWAVMPRDSFFDLNSYYHNTTLKVYRGWKNPITTYEAYKSNRFLIYGLFGLYCLSNVYVSYKSSRNQDVAVRLNEDFWLKEEKIFLKNTKAIYGLVAEKADEIVVDFARPFVMPFIFFFEGPAGVKEYETELKEIRSGDVGYIYEGGKK